MTLAVPSATLVTSVTRVTPGQPPWILTLPTPWCPAQRGVHEIAAHMRVDRGRGVTAMPHLLLQKPTINTVLRQMAHIGMPHRMRRQLPRKAKRITINHETRVDLGRFDPAAALGHPPRPMNNQPETWPDPLPLIGPRRPPPPPPRRHVPPAPRLAPPRLA